MYEKPRSCNQQLKTIKMIKAKLFYQVSSTPTSAQQVRTQQTPMAADQSATMAKLFSAYDVCETSHHLQITHLDLHICDDIHTTDKGSKLWCHVTLIYTKFVFKHCNK